MSVLTSNKLQTAYAQLQTSGARTINNSTGTWTNTGTAKLRYYSLDIGAQNDVNTPLYKTGNRSPLLGVRGRQGLKSWSMKKPFIPSGAAGTKPDDDPLLVAIMGAAATVVASTSVTYNLGSTPEYLFIPRYNTTPGASSPTNVYLLGAVPQTVTFTGGGNFLDYEIGGDGIGVGDSDNFSGYAGSGDAVLDGALTTYPAEPSPITQNGNVLSGFGQSAGFKIGGSALAEVRTTLAISMNLGVELIADALNDAYPIGAVFGDRTISLSNITCIDSDGTVLKTLKEAAFTKAAQTITLQFGTTAGSIVLFTLNNVQIGANSWQESGSALNISFADSMAHASSATAQDDFLISLT